MTQPATRARQPAPDYVPGHDLLRDKVVVVTAAAGAGIGAAVVRRALEEGARAVVLGDTHERRLVEAEQELVAAYGAGRVRTVVCDVTSEAQVQASSRWRIRAATSTPSAAAATKQTKTSRIVSRALFRPGRAGEFPG